MDIHRGWHTGKGNNQKIDGGKSPKQGFSCWEVSASFSWHSLWCRRSLTPASFYWHHSKARLERDIWNNLIAWKHCSCWDSVPSFCRRCTQESREEKLLHPGCPSLGKREPASLMPWEGRNDSRDFCSQHSSRLSRSYIQGLEALKIANTTGLTLSTH